MILISDYIQQFSKIMADHKDLQPWELTNNLENILYELMRGLDSAFDIKDGVAIHRSAMVENGAVLKAPIIISANCFVGANAYLRGPVFLAASVKIGPACEIKQSLIFENTAIAHFNYIGNSIIGSQVNFEAGSVSANHFNERTDKEISVLHDGKVIATGCDKFGSLVGDGCKIGANAVLSPGTLLNMNTVVKRLELIEQLTEKRKS